MVAPKRKRCKCCRKMFTPTRPMQTVCSFECSIEHSKKPKVQKAYQLEAKKELAKKHPDKSKLLKQAQTLVNRYVRLRDKNKPCISCGHKGNRQIHGGHFRPAGQVPQLRFYTLNIFAQCSICNNYKSGNLNEYRESLINRFGIEFVESLESNHETKKYSPEYLERLKEVFSKKIKLYERKFR